MMNIDKCYISKSFLSFSKLRWEILEFNGLWIFILKGGPNLAFVIILKSDLFPALTKYMG